MSTESILAEVAQERLRQQKECGFSQKHDDTLGNNDWIAIAARHLGLAAEDGGESPTDKMRKQFIRLMAISLACIETLDRREEKWRSKIPVCQSMANTHKERVLIIPSGRPSLHGSNGVLSYGVLESLADNWERSNAVYVVEPE